jgi:hypothetical protein
MYAGACVYLISGIVGLVSLVTEAQGTAPESALLTTGAVISIPIPIVLWLWMAWKCKAGRPWARVVSTILFALSTLATLMSLTGSTSAWGLLGVVVSWFIGLGAIILLWQRSSSSYFRTALLGAEPKVPAQPLPRAALSGGIFSRVNAPRLPGISGITDGKCALSREKSAGRQRVRAGCRAQPRRRTFRVRT